MKSINAISATLLSFFATSIALGVDGTDRGNGGDVIYCVDAAGKESAELLDIYEARTLRNINLNLGGAKLSVEEKEELLLTRLKQVSLEAADDLKTKLASFMQESKFVVDANLVDIPDSEHIVFPKNKNCSIRQIIIQQKVTFPEDRKYVVDSQLWELLDTDNQLSLKSHEVIWEKALASGATHSRGVRYFNSYLFSGKIQSLSWAEFHEFGKKSGVRYLPQISGVSMKSIEDSLGAKGEVLAYYVKMAQRIEVTTPFGIFASDDIRYGINQKNYSFSSGSAGTRTRIDIPNGNPIESNGPFSVSISSDDSYIISATTQSGQGYLDGIVRMKIQNGLDQAVDIVSVKLRTPIMIFQDGFLINGETSGLNHEHPVSLPIHGYKIPVTTLVRNYRNFLPERIQFPESFNFKAKIQDQELSVGPVDSYIYTRSGVTFHPNGQISLAVLLQSARLLNVKGQKVRVPSGYQIQLGEDGRLHSMSDKKGTVTQF